MDASAQSQLGRILAARVEGDVQKVLKDGTSVALQNGNELLESDTVKTGKSSSVVLVFENGSSVKLGTESSLAIDEFKIDPLGEAVDLSKLKAEPTVSKTSLNLAYGEMVGDVKKLNIDKGSSFNIRTPVGGTLFRIVFRPTADGKAFFTVSTADGRVVMEGVTAQEIPIETGKEVVVTVEIPAAPTTPTAPGETPAPTPPAPAPVVVTQDIPPATTTVIVEASTSISQALTTTTFTPAPTTPAPTETPPAEEKKEDKKEETPPETPAPPTEPTPPTTPTTPTEPPPPATPPPPTPPPPVTPPAPQLTPGAGG
ncbi:MAG: FecR domain-containing protein [Opitutae bacterium]|nr:FecR domain-containing protein [Opitutae bacterium]